MIYKIPNYSVSYLIGGYPVMLYIHEVGHPNSYTT